MSADTIAKLSGGHPSDKTTVIPNILRFYAEHGPAFGFAAALLKFGRHFEHVKHRPTGLSIGPLGQCYKNCTRAMMHFIADNAPPYFYAEGFALDSELGIPYEHAWLVDRNGRAIDLTWKKTANAVYYGVTFKPEFLLETMRRTEVYGVLFNLGIRDRLFSNPDMFATRLCRPGLPGLPRPAIT